MDLNETLQEAFLKLIEFSKFLFFDIFLPETAKTRRVIE